MRSARPPADSYTGNVATLLTYGEPKKLAGRRSWPDYTSLPLDRDDVPQLIQMTGDPELNQAPDSSLGVWGPLHVWRALGQLGATEAAEPLLALFEELWHDNWARQEIPEVLGMLRPTLLRKLEMYLQDESK